jgi:flagellar hook-length control protein FliK
MMQPTDDIPTLPSTDNIPTLQAAPVSAPVAPDVAPAAIADAIAIEIDPAAATAKTRELVEAASQVADTILVTPSLVRGDGEITIRLKPTVLDGSEIRMEAKGSSISIHIVPATPSVAQTIEQAKAQFEQTLAERLPSFQIAVSVENLKTSTRKRQTA